METFKKDEIQKANKALFLEKVHSFINKGIKSIPKKSFVSENGRFTFEYQIDNKIKLIDIMQHLYNKGFVCFHNLGYTSLTVTIPKSKDDVYDKTKYNKIIVSSLYYPGGNIVKQVSSTSFDEALEAMNTFLEAIEDLYKQSLESYCSASDDED